MARMREAVVYIHGLWMTGLEMNLLAHRLSRQGFAVHRFRYSSILATPEDNAAWLDAYLRTLDADVVHLVGHSLGGLVIMHLFHRFPLQRPGRVVMLGTPVSGSGVAASLARSPLSRWTLGRSIQRGLLGDVPRWKGARDLGMIAGARGLGVGRALGAAPPGEGDGTVDLRETWSDAVTAHLTVPYSHFTLLTARPVAQAVANFLRTGDFAGRTTHS
nr:alpha/beta fold hydrolase [Ectothiorhodospira sp. BSL-9]